MSQVTLARGAGFWIAATLAVLVVSKLLEIISGLDQLKNVLTQWGVWGWMERNTGWAYAIGLGLLVLVRLVVDFNEWWKERMVPPRVQPMKFGPSIGGPEILGMKTRFSMAISNDSGAMLENCVVNIDSFQGTSIGGGMPALLPLRTENQIREGRMGAFDLRPGQSKTVPLLLQDEQGRFFIPHEDGTMFQVDAAAIYLSVSAYSPLHDPSRADVVVKT